MPKRKRRPRTCVYVIAGVQDYNAHVYAVSATYEGAVRLLKDAIVNEFNGTLTPAGVRKLRKDINDCVHLGTFRLFNDADRTISFVKRYI